MRRSSRSKSRARAIGAVVLAGVMLLAACGGDDDDTGEGAGTTTTASDGDDAGELTDSFRGVTADAIKLGVVLIDYECIKDFIDFARGDQQAYYQAVIDDTNANGGVGGRMIEPVYKRYCPVGNVQALEICTALVDDEEVFAVIGVFIDFSGDAQLCLSREGETVHIGHELARSWIDDAPPGLMLTGDVTPERRTEVLFTLFEEEDFLAGKKVGILGDQNVESRVDDLIAPGLDDLGVERGSTAILTVEGTGDTSAALAQLDSFIERWRSERVDVIVMSSLNISARQFVEKIVAALPDVTLVTDQPSTIQQAQDAKEAGIEPNPYRNLVTAEGLTQSEQWARDDVQACMKIVEDATGEPILGPDEVTPDADGKRVEIWIAARDACQDVYLLKLIAEAAGPNLTNDTWTEAVHGMGKFQAFNTEYASLREGKYDADDTFRLVQFDATIGSAGGWRTLTDVIDAG